MTFLARHPNYQNFVLNPSYVALPLSEEWPVFGECYLGKTSWKVMQREVACWEGGGQ